MTPRSPARHRHWGAAGAWLLVAVCGIAHATSLLPETPQARGFLNASSASVKWEATERYAANAGAVSTNTYGWLLCYSDAVLLPATTAEAAADVVGVVAAAGGGALKIRPTSSVYHSTAPFTCPNAYGGGLGSPIPVTGGPLPTSSATPTSVTLLIDSLRGVVGHDPAAHTLTVLAGSRLWQVMQWAADRGLSPPRGATSAWADLSVGGGIATSLQGAGGQDRPSGINDIAVEYVWVDAAGTVYRSPRGSPEGRAIAGGLGIIGFVTEVTLRLQPLSKTYAATLTALPDTNMAADAAAMQEIAGESANIALLWRPDVRKYNAYVLGDAGAAGKISAAMGAAVTGPTFTDDQLPGLPYAVHEAVKALQADVNDTGIAGKLGPAVCATNTAALALQQWAATKHGLYQLPIGTGVTNFVITSWATPKNVPWTGNGMAVDELGFLIEQSDFGAWVDDVRAIVAADLGAGSPKHCLLLNTLLIRFATPADGDIALTSGMRRPVAVAYALLRSRQLPNVPAKYSWLQDQVEQLTLCKYNGRPHFGKNFIRTFTSAACPVRDKYAQFNALLAQQAIYDPNKIWEPPLFASVVARAGPLSTSPLCALRKECYCATDDQCAAGWVCVPGRAFPQYNSCVPAGLKWREVDG